MRIRPVPVLLFALGCSGATELPTGGAPLPVTRLRDASQAFTSYSGMRQSRRLVIRDDATWASAWATIWSSVTPAPALPAVDFTHDMVVVASLGERPSGGYGISVDSAKSTGSGVSVFVGTASPGSHCVLTAAFTQPVDVARLPRLDAPVRFHDVATVHDCQ